MIGWQQGKHGNFLVGQHTIAWSNIDQEYHIVSKEFIRNITLVPHECHAISNHWQLHCLFNSLFKLASKQHQSSILLALCEGIHVWPVVLCMYIMMTSSKWENFPRNWPFVRGIHRSPVNSPHKGQWRGALMFSLICVWINDWINNHEAGDLRCYHTHYDVIVMW